MKKWFVISIIVFCCAFTAQQLPVMFAVPQGWPAPKYDFAANPLTEEKIALGRKLFFDPLLSRDNTISCASCHLPQTAFTHVDHALSHGIENRIGKRNSPALINLAWSGSFMWDGSVHNLDVQALAPISNPDEMGESIGNVVKKLNASAEYRRLAQLAFGGDSLTGQHLLQSLSQFMLTLISKDSKYDRVMRGDDGIAFNEYEEKGYALFRANCGNCHREPLFTNDKFENNGLPADSLLRDNGNEGVTKRPSDRGKFKVPTLRNIEVTYPYMHDGRFANLQMVLFHYTEGIQQSPTLSPLLQKKIILSEDDKRDLIAFLKTLTDENFLHDPNHQYKP